MPPKAPCRRRRRATEGAVPSKAPCHRRRRAPGRQRPVIGVYEQPHTTAAHVDVRYRMRDSATRHPQLRQGRSHARSAVIKTNFNKVQSENPGQASALRVLVSPVSGELRRPSSERRRRNCASPSRTWIANASFQRPRVESALRSCRNRAPWAYRCGRSSGVIARSRDLPTRESLALPVARLASARGAGVRR